MKEFSELLLFNAIFQFLNIQKNKLVFATRFLFPNFISLTGKRNKRELYGKKNSIRQNMG